MQLKSQFGGLSSYRTVSGQKVEAHGETVECSCFFLISFKCVFLLKTGAVGLCPFCALVDMFYLSDSHFVAHMGGSK